MLPILFQHLKLDVLRHLTMQNKTLKKILTEDEMSPLSNYCENTTLTPTNTCVPSSKLDILQFKMLCFLLRKKKPKKTNRGYFTTIILSPSSVYSLDSSVTFLSTVMPLFNITHGLILRSILLSTFIISLACGSKHTFSAFADDANWGGNGQYTRGHCPERLWNPHSWRFSRLN